MAKHVPSKCPDCDGTLKAVLLFGRGPQSAVGAATDAAVAYYTEPNADRSFFLAMYEPLGEVHAALCTSCHRILLYGVPG